MIDIGPCEQRAVDPAVTVPIILEGNDFASQEVRDGFTVGLVVGFV